MTDRDATIAAADVIGTTALVDLITAGYTILPTVEFHRWLAWRSEAMTVLAEWDRVWEDTGSPGGLGQSKAAGVRAVLLKSAAETAVIDAAVAERTAEREYSIAVTDDGDAFFSSQHRASAAEVRRESIKARRAAVDALNAERGLT